MIILQSINGSPGELAELQSAQGPQQCLSIQVGGEAVQSLNLDGLTPINFDILPAGHKPGLYLWTIYLVKRVAASAGNLVAVLNYTDTSGAAQLTRPNASLSGATGHFNLSPFPVWSTGATALNIDMTFPGVAGGTLQMDVYNSVFKVG